MRERVHQWHSSYANSYTNHTQKVDLDKDFQQQLLPIKTKLMRIPCQQIQVLLLLFQQIGLGLSLIFSCNIIT